MRTRSRRRPLQLRADDGPGLAAGPAPPPAVAGGSNAQTESSIGGCGADLAGAPGVAESAVVGVPDGMMGEKVGVVIVPLPGAEIDPRHVAAHVGRRLADFKVPQYVAIREEPLPRNAGGKIVKAQLREETTWGAPLR